jgi:phosphohistidine phosphatase
MRLLKHHGQSAHMLVVGHEPDLSGVVRELTGVRVDLKKAGLAMVRIDASAKAAERRNGELVVPARPRELALIAGMTVGEV